MAFEPRTYRNLMNRERFRFFNIVNKETDLWIGVTHNDYRQEIEQFITHKVSQYRSSLEKYIIENPSFRTSLAPLPLSENAPEIIKLMSHASASASVGPMAAVAGAVSEIVGDDIINSFNPRELIIENGGDIFLSIKEEILIQFYAGKNKDFEKIVVSIPPKDNRLGVCTSSGTYGHSFSFGKADSVTVICCSAAFADAWATSICNKIIVKDDNKNTTV